MIELQGQGVSGGIAGGTLYFHRPPAVWMAGQTAADAGREIARWIQARNDAAGALAGLAERSRAEAGEEAAALFEAHGMLAADEDMDRVVRDRIEGRRCTAEQAVTEAAEQFARQFEAMDDPYMRARAADVRDVAGRMMRLLAGTGEAVIDPPGPVVLAAEDLTPSETVRLDRSRILALITQAGSVNSHTAILARSMGIPAVCGLGERLNAAMDGRQVYVDGTAGTVTIDPDRAALALYEEKRLQTDRRKTELEAMRGLEDTTGDGRRMELCCNIGSASDVHEAIRSGSRGIGLFRSEFLFLSSGHPPDEEEQFEVYRAAVSAMQGRRVVIRTLDVGADKQAAFLPMKREENPALGMRAVRISLSRPDLFLPQLRAIYRASAYGKTAILFPMISSLWELRKCRAYCEQAMEQLRRERIEFDRTAEIGVMIETPASVLIARELAREADFFSVGTNDLTQYLLACDRQNGDSGRYYDPHHPAVFRAVRMAADAAHEAGVRIGVCGELAADPEMLPVFLELGIDSLSVPPPMVLELRRRLRNIGKAQQDGET